MNQIGANKITKNATDKIRYFPGCADRNNLTKGNYILAVREMSAYMRAKYGIPLSMLRFKPGQSSTDALIWKTDHGDAKRAEFMNLIALKTGIVVILRPGTNVGGTGVFSGHVDLWDMGEAFHDDSVTATANQIEFWAVD